MTIERRSRMSVNGVIRKKKKKEILEKTIFAYLHRCSPNYWVFAGISISWQEAKRLCRKTDKDIWSEDKNNLGRAADMIAYSMFKRFC